MNKIMGINLEQEYHEAVPLNQLLKIGKFSINNLIHQIENFLKI